MATKLPFEINIGEDSFTVKTALKRSLADIITRIAMLLIFTCVLTFHLLITPSNQSTAANPGELDSSQLLLAAVIFALVFLFWAFSFVRSLFPSGESVDCDRSTLKVGRIPAWNFHGQWTFQTYPIVSIKDARFGIFRIGQNGGSMGILFQVDEKTIKTLEGIEAPEANKILNGLAHLGVPIQRDPGITMMVEMVETRRKGMFRWFFQ